MLVHSWHSMRTTRSLMYPPIVYQKGLAMWEASKGALGIGFGILILVASTAGIFSSNADVSKPAMGLWISLAIAGGAYLMAMLIDKVVVKDGKLENHLLVSMFLLTPLMFVMLISIFVAMIFGFAVVANGG